MNCGDTHGRRLHLLSQGRLGQGQALAAALKIENIDVWWDTALEAGETFDEKIQTVLEQVKCVIVVWSKESVKSEWVRAESSVGRERGILVPVMVQPVNIPVPFNLLHTADLIGWSGDRSHAGYQDVVKQVKATRRQIQRPAAEAAAQPRPAQPLADRRHDRRRHRRSARRLSRFDRGTFSRARTPPSSREGGRSRDRRDG